MKVLTTPRSYGKTDPEVFAMLRAAGLDVWAEEPPRNEALYRHPKVSCTPHIGAATLEAQARVGAEVVSVIQKFFA